jgi:outer membrane protein assembly factor BamA
MHLGDCQANPPMARRATRKIRRLRSRRAPSAVAGLLLGTVIGLDGVRAEEEIPSVKKTRVVGAEAVDAGEIVSELQHHPPRGFLFWRRRAELDEAALELDRRRVQSFLRWRGYYRARVPDVRVETIRPGRVEVVFEADLGPPSRLARFDVAGLPPDGDVDPEALRRELGLRDGAVVDYEAYEALKRRIRGRLIARGYVHVEIDGAVEIRADDSSTRIVLRIDPGPVAHFGPVQIQPPTPVPVSAIENRIAWSEGDRFDPDDIELTEGRLYQLGAIGSVQFDWPTTTRTATLPVTISTSPSTPRELKLGGGFARDNVNYEFRLRGAYRQTSFFHPLNTLRLELRPAFVFRQDLTQPGFNIDASAEVDRDDFVLPRVTGTIGVGYRLTQFEAFDTTGPRVSGSIQRPFLRDRLKPTLSVGFEYLWVGFDDVRDSLTDEERQSFGLFPTLPITTVNPSVAYDARDNPRAPRLGWYGRIGFSFGYTSGEADSGYVLIEPELRGYVPLGSRLVFAARARLGTTLTEASVVPAPRRYFAGGAQSQRGFANRRLAPSVENADGETVPLGGEALVETSVEARLHLFDIGSLPFGMVAFLDGADVGVELSDIRFPDLHWAVGGGLRLSTPVGPLRFDVGYRATRQDEILPTDNVGERLAWHLTIGEAF